MKLTDTQADVLLLIAAHRHIGDYVPRYKPGAQRGRGGAFPVTIAARAQEKLIRAGLVERDAASGKTRLTARHGGCRRSTERPPELDAVSRMNEKCVQAVSLA